VITKQFSPPTNRFLPVKTAVGKPIGNWSERTVNTKKRLEELTVLNPKVFN
jgi:hypothetical protein